MVTRPRAEGRWRAVFALIAALALIVAACSPAVVEEPDPDAAVDPVDDVEPDVEPDVDDERTLVTLNARDVTSIDATHMLNIYDRLALEPVFDSPVRRSPGGDNVGQAIPHIFTDWEVSDDGLVWSVEMRDDVLFHNGDQMTAEDIKFSFDRIMDLEVNISTNYVSVEELVVTGDYSLEFHLERLEPLLIHNMPNILPIIPKDYYEEVGEEAFQEEPIGSGPYRIVEWRRDDAVVLEAFDDYFLGAPEIKRVEMRVVEDEGARTAAMLAGEAHIAHPFGPDQAQPLRDEPSIDVIGVSSLERQFVRFDTNQEPFGDIRVRQALNYAVDRQAIIDSVLGGFARITPVGSVSIEPGQTPLDPYPYDPDRARELLAEAGYPDGFEVGFEVRDDYVKSVEVAQAIAAQLSEVGVETDIQIFDGGAHSERARDKDILALSYTGWGGGAAFRADHLYWRTLRCEGVSPVWGGFYCDEFVDDKIAEMEQLLHENPDQAFDPFEELEIFLQEEAPLLWLWENEQLYAVSDEVDWDPSPIGHLWWFDASWAS